MNECYYMGMSLMTLFMGLFPSSPPKMDAHLAVANQPPVYLSYHCEAEGAEAQYQQSIKTMFPLDGQKADYGQGFACLDAAAKGGHPKAQFYLGMSFKQGTVLENEFHVAFVPQNKVQARYWLEQSAKQGDAEAQFYLATFYTTGEGGGADDTLARYWYEKAALQGHAHAQKQLALAYLNGKGIDVNPALSYQWFRVAQKTLVNDLSIQKSIADLEPQLSDAQRRELDLRVAVWVPKSQPQFSAMLLESPATAAFGIEVPRTSPRTLSKVKVLKAHALSSN